MGEENALLWGFAYSCHLSEIHPDFCCLTLLNLDENTIKTVVTLIFVTISDFLTVFEWEDIHLQKSPTLFIINIWGMVVGVRLWVIESSLNRGDPKSVWPNALLAGAK